MSEENRELKIITNRNIYSVYGNVNSGTVIESLCNKKADNLLDWLINTKCSLMVIPITMRKISAYALNLTGYILRLPLVLRKRFMYEKIVNG